MLYGVYFNRPILQNSVLIEEKDRLSTGCHHMLARSRPGNILNGLAQARIELALHMAVH